MERMEQPMRKQGVLDGPRADGRLAPSGGVEGRKSPGTPSAQSSRRYLFMNKGEFRVRSLKSSFAVLQRPTIERSVDGSWRVLFRCWWSAPTILTDRPNDQGMRR